MKNKLIIEYAESLSIHRSIQTVNEMHASLSIFIFYSTEMLDVQEVKAL